MAIPSVKTSIMVALGELFSTIEELKTVERFRGKPIDLEVIPLPALYFYDDGEERKRNNQQQNGIIDLISVVFFLLDEGEQKPVQVFSDEADLIQARVHSLLFGTDNLRNVGIISIQEGSIHKEYPSDIFGILVMRHELEYTHKFGNAFLI